MDCAFKKLIRNSSLHNRVDISVPPYRLNTEGGDLYQKPSIPKKPKYVSFRLSIAKRIKFLNLT